MDARSASHAQSRRSPPRGIRLRCRSISELRVDDVDRQTPGVIGLDSVHQFEQLALGGLGPNERSYLSFILAA
jgi:hypothetical protein